MLFVDNHQAEAIERREDCRSRPDDDVDLSPADAVPLIVTLAVRKRAVLNRDAAAEGAAEKSRDGRCQRDLRHQQQHLAPCATHAIGQPQINLRLAASRHAVKEGDLKFSRVGERKQLFDGTALLLGQLAARIGRHVGHRGTLERVALVALVAERDEPLFASPASTAAVTPRSRSSEVGRPAGATDKIARAALCLGTESGAESIHVWRRRSESPRHLTLSATVAIATLRCLNADFVPRAPGGIATASASPMPAT